MTQLDLDFVRAQFPAFSEPTPEDRRAGSRTPPPVAPRMGRDRPCCGTNCSRKAIAFFLGALVMLCPIVAGATADRFADHAFQGIVTRVSFNGFIYFGDNERPHRLAYIRPNADILRKLIHGKSLECRTVRIQEHFQDTAPPISCPAFQILCERFIDVACNTTKPVWEILPFKWRTLEGYMLDQGVAEYLCEPRKRHLKRCR